jgi:hypothetical protein
VRREVYACGALQSVRFGCSILGVSTSDRPLRIGCSFRVPHSPLYRPCLVRRSHFAVDRFLGCVVFQTASFAGHFSVSRSSPLFELRLHQEYYPAIPSRSVATDQLLSWAFVPYSTYGTGGSLHAGLPARHVPPSGFGYPLGGLHPLIPCRFYFAPAALMGFTLRSFPLSKGIRSF